MRYMWFFLVLILLAIVYVGWHLWLLLPLSAAWKSAVLAFGVVCFLLLFLSVARRLDSLPLALARASYILGTSSIIVFLYLTIIFFLLDLGRLVNLVPQSFLCGSLVGTGCIFFAVFAFLLYGNFRYNHKECVELQLQARQPLSKSYRAVMLSDMHIGYHNSRKELARWVDLINSHHPDFILVAGDIIDGSMRPVLDEDMAAEFRRLSAPVYACLGNHEYYADRQQAIRFCRDAGIHLLVDSAATIDSSFVIIGRDDRTNPRRKTLADLTATAPHADFSIVLDHQPYHLEESEQAGVDFQFSGHTHRGQVWPVSWITDAIYECSWGNHQRGRTHYYVSSGMGIWGAMFRIGTQSEYVMATIQ